MEEVEEVEVVEVVEVVEEVEEVDANANAEGEVRVEAACSEL